MGEDVAEMCERLIISVMDAATEKVCWDMCSTVLCMQFSLVRLHHQLLSLLTVCMITFWTLFNDLTPVHTLITQQF